MGKPGLKLMAGCSHECWGYPFPASSRDILCQRSQAQNSLFDLDAIEKCKIKHQVPVLEDFRELVQGVQDRRRAWPSKEPAWFADNTILIVLANTMGEPEIFLLDQVKEMQWEFKEIPTESAFDVCQFYERYVRFTGSLIVQAA